DDNDGDEWNAAYSGSTVAADHRGTHLSVRGVVGRGRDDAYDHNAEHGHDVYRDLPRGGAAGKRDVGDKHRGNIADGGRGDGGRTDDGDGDEWNAAHGGSTVAADGGRAHVSVRGVVGWGRRHARDHGPWNEHDLHSHLSAGGRADGHDERKR